MALDVELTSGPQATNGSAFPDGRPASAYAAGGEKAAAGVAGAIAKNVSPSNDQTTRA